MEAFMKVLPDNILRCMSSEDRKKLGKAGQTAEETLTKAEITNESQLQGQIVNLLRLRGIEPLWHRTDKKSRATVGWPDLTFCVWTEVTPFYKLGQPCVWEIKLPGRKLSEEQRQMMEKLVLNGWHWQLITSVDDALKELASLGVETI